MFIATNVLPRLGSEMSWSREEALTDPAIRLPLMFASEFRFHLRDIPTEIVLRVYRPLHSGRMVVRCSHALSIPQVHVAEAASSDDDGSDTEGEALHRAVAQLVEVYNAARGQGLTPEPSWLKPNETFC